MWTKNRSSASRPPADAPRPTMWKGLLRDVTAAEVPGGGDGECPAALFFFIGALDQPSWCSIQCSERVRTVRTETGRACTLEMTPDTTNISRKSLNFNSSWYLFPAGHPWPLRGRSFRHSVWVLCQYPHRHIKGKPGIPSVPNTNPRAGKVTVPSHGFPLIVIATFPVLCPCST